MPEDAIPERLDIKYIYHLSDIHIRPLQRHSEYIKVFKNFVKTIKTNKAESIIIICGDVFHVRDKLLSETLIVFNEMVEIFQDHVEHIFIIPGNHDSFKSNERLDSIYGITHIKNFRNLTFLYNSCIIEYRNLNIIHNYFNETFYDIESYKKYIIENDLNENNVSVCLYHGIVHKDSENYYGKTYKKISDFSGYDFVLLGDIHESAFLKNNIAYSGSLIQQDFSESTSKGYILWDLDNKNGIFCNVKNIYSYITLDIIDKQISNLEDIQFTKYSNVRLILDKCANDYDSLFFEDIKNSIECKTNILSMAKTFKNLIKNLESIEAKIDSEKLLHENETESFHEIVNKLCEGDSELIEKVYSLHNEYKSSIDFTDKIYTNSWKIDSVKFKNIFIYGGDIMNEINFKEGITGILGNNAIGKSCILYIIIYCLFGQITKSKNYNNRNIVHKNSQNYYIELTINFSKLLSYKIVRKGKNRVRKSGSGIEESVSFFKIDNKTVSDISLMTKTETEKNIKDILGITNKEDFIFTNIISNILYKNVLTLSNSEFEEIMSNLFNTKIYKELFNYTKEQLKILTKELGIVEGKKEVLSKQINDTSQYIQPKEYNLLKTKKNTLETKLKEINAGYLEYSKYSSIFNQYKTESNVNNKVLLLDNRLNSLKQNFTEEYDDISEKDLLKLKNEIYKFNKSNTISYEIPENFKKDKDYSQILLELQMKLKELETTDNNSKTHEDIICLEYLKELKVKIKSVEDIKKYRSELMKIGAQMVENPYESSKNIYNECNIDLKNKIEEDLKNCKDCISYQNYIKYLELNEKFSNMKTNLLIKNLEIEKENLLNSLKYNKIFQDKKQIEKEYNDIKEEIVKYNVHLENKDKCKEEYEEIISKYNLISDKVKLNTLYKNLVSDKYLPKSILSNTVSKLQNEANEIIFTLCNMYINFDINDSYKWNITISKNDMTLGPEQCSGYERFIINIALKIVFDKYKFYSGIKMFFIDEGLDCISEENYDKIDQLFELLKKYYNTVLIISHNETLKKKVENIISISSNFKCSHIDNK